MTFDDFKALVGLSFRDPQAAARDLMAQGWPIQARWMALLAAVSVSALLASLAAALFSAPGPEGDRVVVLSQQPMVLAVMQMGAIVLAAGLMSGVGRMFGGGGRFEDALLLTVWIEVLLLIVQAAQVVLSLILPGVAGIFGLLAIALFLWLTVQFTKALHGFHSTPKVVLGMIGTVFVAGFVLSLLAAALGIMPEMPQ
ncbi:MULTISPECIES: YIP1 family protein [Paracoccus]|uniref:YIP1 family protein n=1 Tax=Paracoccus aerius TaxID=1915382 RepID=A0ABS1S9W7_9RHOB|nr:MULTISPECIES: YIP1 family protein [Paracoccus]MBL3674904.1 YIP1 family protein [Paracoccus aerius]QIR85160.1 YIP1 family protein [Paracoccus sp. AK26]GHG29802.1 YIP1 family protein [Paracoccus aerius]